MDRFWLLTSTTYGAWLPGDQRGSVTRVREDAGPRLEHDQPRTAYIGAVDGLRKSSAEGLKGESIYLSFDQASVVAAQFRETAEYRGWSILACAVMSNHFHLVVGVLGDPDPSDLLRDFKSYASRPLNRRWGRPPSNTWWTAKGSKRKKSDWSAIQNAVEYVRNQANPLVVWVDEEAVEAARQCFAR